MNNKAVKTLLDKVKEFEDFLLAHLDNYLIPSDQVAIFIDSHNADHVVLLLQAMVIRAFPF